VTEGVKHDVAADDVVAQAVVTYADSPLPLALGYPGQLGYVVFARAAIGIGAECLSQPFK
jgi:hypothetical protein